LSGSCYSEYHDIYLYQATFTVPEEVILQSLKGVGARIGDLRPDFIRLQRKGLGHADTITIIEAKASWTIRGSHQAQVGQ